MNQSYRFVSFVHGSDQKTIKNFYTFPICWNIHPLERFTWWRVRGFSSSSASKFWLDNQGRNEPPVIPQRVLDSSSHALPCSRKYLSMHLPSFCQGNTCLYLMHFLFQEAFPDVSPHPHINSPLNCTCPNQAFITWNCKCLSACLLPLPSSSPNGLIA